jgi:hypothetical protein
MVAPPAKAGLNEVARMPSRRSSNFLEYWQKKRYRELTNIFNLGKRHG